MRDVDLDPYAHCLDGCEDLLEELLNIVERLVVKRLAGHDPEVEELEEVLYTALDLYKCVRGGDGWS